MELAAFRGAEEAGWVDWYETSDSQQLLAYQEHVYSQYLETLRAEVERLLAEDC